MMAIYTMLVYCLVLLLGNALSNNELHRLPFLRKTGNTVKITKNIEMINLSTLHVPLSVTFSLYDHCNYLLDPTLLEEKCANGILIVTANKFNEICYLHTYGSVKVDTNNVSDLLMVTKDKIKYLNKILKNFKDNTSFREVSADMDIDDNNSIPSNKLKVDRTERGEKINIYQINNI
jgi:hypothetical protein